MSPAPYKKLEAAIKKLIGNVSYYIENDTVGGALILDFKTIDDPDEWQPAFSETAKALKAAFPQLPKDALGTSSFTIRITDPTSRQAIINAIRAAGGILNEPIAIDFGNEPEIPPSTAEVSQPPSIPTPRIHRPGKTDKTIVPKQPPLTLASCLTAIEAAANPHEALSAPMALEQLETLQTLLTPLLPPQKTDEKTPLLPSNGNGQLHAPSPPAMQATWQNTLTSCSDGERTIRMAAIKKLMMAQISDSQRPVTVQTKPDGRITFSLNRLRDEPQPTWHERTERVSKVINAWLGTETRCNGNTITATIDSSSPLFNTIAALAKGTPPNIRGTA